MKLLKQIETLFRTGTAGGLTDGQLLERFLERRDELAEAAFAALVDRHGAMVLRVCRQILAREEDAEDAAQATFLVLARRAGSISRHESVGCWLHGVALRVAAKARTAAARRHAHELRGGEMKSGVQVLDAELGAIENHDDWAKLHDELRTLPESFREPLILCYLEGLTQDQAAAHLHCPLGTIQSRLARGRAKLKARLEKRGVTVASAFGGDGHLAIQSCPASAAWAEATVKLAMQFTQGNGAAIAGASAATVAMAEEVARAIVMTKMKITAAMILFVAVLVSGAAAWAMHDRTERAPVVATKIALPVLNAEPEHPQGKAPAPPDRVTRTIRGTVRDEQGRPLAKAWIGDAVTPRPQLSLVIPALDRIRERKEPFRNELGKIVPAGALGKYFELRDDEGKWQSIHPADISRYELSVPQTDSRSPFEYDATEEVKSALSKGNDVFKILTGRGRWEMSSLVARTGPANRTDPQGNFLLEFTMYPKLGAQEVHFASPDFSRQALVVVRYEDPDQALKITLRPARLVRARVLETPKDHPKADLAWDVYSLDAAPGNLDHIPAIGEKAAHWLSGPVELTNTGNSSGETRLLEVRLPPGRYKVKFESDTLYRVVDVVVPPGDGPLELPDIHLETLAWAQMLGKPTAEIDAVDLDGKPVTLADYRGKVTVLAFWSSKHESEFRSVPLLSKMKERFKGQPVAILALHDAARNSLATVKKGLAPIREQFAGEIPIRFLLDRSPIDKPRSPYSPSAGEEGSGRTADTYESYGRETFVIDKNGRMAFAIVHDFSETLRLAIGKNGELDRDVVEEEIGEDGQHDLTKEIELLEAALEDQLGLPRSRPLSPQSTASEPPKAPPRAPSVLKGKVVDLDGRPIAGARVSGSCEVKSGKAVMTGPAGDFTYNPGTNRFHYRITVEASEFATRVFSFESDAISPFDTPEAKASEPVGIDSSGIISDALRMGPGVIVTGRVLHEGKPVAGVSLGLHFVDSQSNPNWREDPKTNTDESGSFRFPRMLPDTAFYAYAKIGSLADGGAVSPQRFQTAEDGSTLDLGEFHVEKGLTLAGRVVCSDGKTVPSGTRISAECSDTGDILSLTLSDTARFEFKGLPAGPVSVMLTFTNERPAIRYRVSAKNICLNPARSWGILEGQLDHDIADLIILLEPGTDPDRRFEIDPALEADFNDAKAGPITGVPPRP